MSTVVGEDGDLSGCTWDHELTITAGTDLREPFFLQMDGGPLRFFYFEAGANPVEFEPGRLLRIERFGENLK